MKLLDIYTQYPVLIDAIKYIIENNPGNGHSYHGIDHLFTVFKYACDVSEYNKCENRLELLVAALFHDYDHKGKMGNDNENILKACDGLSEFHTLFPVFDLAFACYIITCTEYPYVVPEEDLTKEGKIIRDCDLSYLFEDLSIVKLYYGLRTEFGTTLEQFVSSQDKFFNSVKFYDDVLQLNWEHAKSNRFAELELLKNTPDA